LNTKIKIWDLPIRLFHWLLPVLLGFSWYTAEIRAIDWHLRSGYTLMFLIIFRIIWGFCGSETARFANFVRGAKAVIDYLRIQPDAKPSFAGHNPLAGWSVIFMLVALTLQVLTGLFAVDVDGIDSGPLSLWVSFDTGRTIAELHEWCFNLLLLITVTHLLAIAWYEVWKKERLVIAMISGFKRLPEGSKPGLSLNLRRLTFAVIISIGIVYLVSTGLQI
jgi:cytochrome b